MSGGIEKAKQYFFQPSMSFERVQGMNFCWELEWIINFC